MGYLYLVEVETPFVYISARVSQTPFIHASLTREGGIIALSRDGRMTKLTINDSTIIEFVAKTRGNPQSASHIASSAGLQISGDFMNQQLDQLIRQGNYVEAAHCAANSPGGSLRNMQTIQKLLSIQTMGGAPPLLQYFNELLNITKLNEVESIELCRIVVNLNKTNLIEKWIKEDKLTPSEALGDVCRPDPRIAVAIYLRANVSEKVVATFAEMNAFDKLQAYCQKMSYTPNWMQIITIVARTAPDKAEPLLTHVANNGQPLVDAKQVVNLLVQFQMIRQAIRFLIDVLQTDREEDSDLQTMLFEIALKNMPKLAEELFVKNIFHVL
ncbi:putative clathrin heavy chain [Histomonas meleagridis]|nr:putative clathrin heavy chain [Histomonas meleagridis]